MILLSLVIAMGVPFLVFIIMHRRNHLNFAILVALILGVIGFFLAEPFGQYAFIGYDIFMVLTGMSLGVMTVGLVEIVIILREHKKQVWQ